MLFCDTSITTISRGAEQSREERTLCAATAEIVIALPPNMWMLKRIQHKWPWIKKIKKIKSWRNTISIGSVTHKFDLTRINHKMIMKVMAAGKIYHRARRQTNTDNPFNTLLI